MMTKRRGNDKNEMRGRKDKKVKKEGQEERSDT